MATVLGPGGYPVSGQSAGGTSTTVQLASNMQQLEPAFSVTNKVGAALAGTMQHLTPAFNMTNAIPLLAGGTVPSSFASPMSYPFGVQPSLNPLHPIFSGLRLAAVTGLNGALYDLLSGQVVTSTGFKTIITPAGVGFNSSTSAAAPAFNPLIPGEVFSNLTLAVIFEGRVPPVPMTLLGISNVYANGYPKIQVTSTGQMQFAAFSFGWPYTNPPVLIAGHMYFMVGSYTSSITHSLNITIIDMTTGQTVLNQLQPPTVTAQTGQAYYPVGGQTVSAVNGTIVVCAAIANQYLTLQQQLAWAAYPWSLWYAPNESLRYMTAPAIAASSVSLAANMQRLQPAFNMTSPVNVELYGTMQDLQSRVLVQTAGGGGLTPDNPKFVADVGKMMTH